RRQLTAIQEDLPPESERFVDDHYKSRCLDNLPRGRSGADLRHALGQAIRVRVLSRMRSVGALIKHCLGPRLERDVLLEVGGEVPEVLVRIGLPDAGQVRLTIRQSRRGCREIRLAVSGAGNCTLGNLGPL